MKKGTVYIAAKISGLPYWTTYYHFMLREIRLKLLGYKTINPMRCVPKHLSYDEQMSICLLLVKCASTIYIGSNWNDSKGAKKELREYLRTGKNEVIYYRW